jgi:thiol-disulfide isomerase/thioredoxin
MNNSKRSEITLAVATVLGTVLIVALTLVNVGNGSQHSKAMTQTNQKLASDEQSMLGLILHAKPRPLPELTFVDGGERRIRLSDFQGKVILLNIWATWCPPCREEMPALDRLEARLGGPSFQVVPLSIDSGGAAPVASFYQAAGLESLGVYLDAAQGGMRKLSIVGVPTTLLIDRQGGEVGRVTGPAEWDEPEIVHIIEQLLAAPAS